MSYTEIYTLGKEHCEQIGETKNAWRGAMYVWNEISIKYLGLERFPMFDESLQRKVWNAAKYYTLTDAEKIVLASTMDNVTVKKSDIPKLIEAFEEYHKENPNSSLSEQAEIIKNAELLDDHVIAWNQTSVNWYKYRPRYISLEDYMEQNELEPEDVEGFEEDEEIPIYEDISDTYDLFEQIKVY